MLSRISTRVIASLLIISILVPSALLSYPQKAEAKAECLAQIAGALGISKVAGVLLKVPVNTGTLVEMSVGGSFVTDCILKPLAVQLAKAMLYNITVSTVNWINSGFQGNPGFVQDFKGLLTDTADQMIGEFIAKDLGAGFLCSPFSFQIKIALAQSYLPYKRKSACTLTQITGNVGGFVQGNNSGGWDNWLQVTTVPQNNAYGAFALAQDELSKKIFDAQAAKEKYLDWGNGFRDWEVCETQAQADQRSGFNFDAPGADQSLRPAPICEKRTPGAVVQDRLSATLNIDLQQLAVADSINAIMDALANQVTKQIVTGAQGLLGSKRQGGGYGSVSYTAALANSGANDPALNNAINTSLASSTGAVSTQLQQNETTPVATSEDPNVTASQQAELVDVQKTDTISGTNPFRMQTELQTNYNATDLTIVTTLKKDGAPVPFATVFLRMDASGGGDGRWATVNTNVSYPSVTWTRASATAAHPYSFVISGARRPGSGAGRYTLETIVTNRAGNQIVPLKIDELVVQ